MNRIKTLRDVINWRLCTGCGICSFICGKDAIEMRDIDSLGIRPFILDEDRIKNDECIAVCPGYSVSVKLKEKQKDSLLIGPYIDIWEGAAADKEIQLSASSGGIISALALYCIEKEDMSIILHTGMDPENPWKNKTVVSRNKKDLLRHTGSRYTPSSPCSSIDKIIQNKNRSVFIGKPCDVEAISMLRKQNPELDKKLGLVLSFFCAGTPSTNGIMEFLKKNHIKNESIKQLKYRGNGWPGNFIVNFRDGSISDSTTYEETWGFLSKFKPIRCQLCPDGLGELSDISCGDAWHKLKDDTNPGCSLIIVRSKRGKDILKKASETGYVDIYKSTPSVVIKAQELINRRKELFGRLLAFKSLMIPVTRFQGFNLSQAWRLNCIHTRINTMIGTYKRILLRNYWLKKR